MAGATMAARVEAIGHTLPRTTPSTGLLPRKMHKQYTSGAVSVGVLWVSRLVWIVGYEGGDTLY